METLDKKKADFLNFQKQFEKKVKQVPFNDYNQYFYAKNYFYVNKILYGEDRFYDVIFEMISNIIKARLQELEYYVNLKPQTLTNQIEAETVQTDIKTIQKFCLKFQIYYEMIHKIGISNQTNTIQTTKLLDKMISDVREVAKLSVKLQDEFIKGFKKQIKEIENHKTEVKYESSMYN